MVPAELGLTTPRGVCLDAVVVLQVEPDLQVQTHQVKGSNRDGFLDFCSEIDDVLVNLIFIVKII